MKRSALVLSILFALSLGLTHAVDFGIIVDQSAGVGGLADNGEAEYTADLIPRFSSPIGDYGDFYVSASLAFGVGDDIITFVPELLRTEFSWLFSFGELSAGRIYYTDPLGFIANGLFDGARVSVYTQAGTFSAGAWYTGLLYKRRAGIAMTEKEMEAYASDPDIKDLTNTYFAPKRFVTALGWEHLSLGGPLQVRAAALAQFDLSGGLHSQYVVGRATLPLSFLTVDLGACLELIQNEGTFGIAGAIELGVQAPLPTPFQDRLSFTARYSSGGKDTAFLPLTTQTQGDILKAKLSGLSLLSLDYTARFLPSLSAGVSTTYFIRSDLETYTAYPLTGDSDGYFLGEEFFARLMWNPFSDMQINLGGGVFLPSLGNAAPDSAAAWRVELNLVLSF